MRHRGVEFCSLPLKEESMGYGLREIRKRSDSYEEADYDEKEK